ncbi:MAG TPA: chemotaxis protein CheA [Steroidobacteraceae bacterium]|nr:chemotaxis protein CheA [Steroidobacteraceae bacterium]
MSLEMDQFHEVYFAESFELLDAMEAALLRLTPGTADVETVNTIFRVAHSIKGGAGMFGFNQIASFTHTLETLLDELRSGRMQVTAPMCDGLLSSVDLIRAMLTAQQKQQPWDATEAQALQEQFREMVEPAPAAAAPATAAVDVPPVAVQPAARPAAPGITTWRISFAPLPALLVRGVDPVRLFEDLAGLGKVTVDADLSGLPALEDLDPAHCCIRWALTLATPMPRASIELIFDWAEGDCELAIERVEASAVAQPASAPLEPAPIAAPAPAPAIAAAPAATPAPAPAPVAATVEVNSIRVAIEKIDELLNVVGEVVITQSMLGQLARDFEGVNADRLRAGLAQLESNVRELQESVMRVRMLPVGSVFSRFPRLVRDLSARLGKQIRLQLSGEQTELDKTVLEKIGDPLVHLVRNSVDHGIETVEERLAAGKPVEGTITLNAFHKGGTIKIVISDDGKGLHRERLLEKARAKGLIAADAVLTDQQVNELIFMPGFSTAAQTTDLSGRGVGMDVVRRNIKELGGNVELKSEPGKGTTTTITLPLTLAIVDGQTVQVGNETYIVPLVGIIESLQLRDGAAHEVYEHGEVFHFRGDYVPVIRLHEVFGIEPRSRNLADGLLMVVEGDGRRAGLFIDALLGQQQVVIKSMETHYARIPGVGGATILGEGSVALILDVPGLLRLAASRAPALRRTGT